LVDKKPVQLHTELGMCWVCYFASAKTRENVNRTKHNHAHIHEHANLQVIFQTSKLRTKSRQTLMVQKLAWTGGPSKTIWLANPQVRPSGLTADGLKKHACIRAACTRKHAHVYTCESIQTQAYPGGLTADDLKSLARGLSGRGLGNRAQSVKKRSVAGEGKATSSSESQQQQQHVAGMCCCAPVQTRGVIEHL